MAVGSLGDMASKLYQRSMQAEQVKGMRIDNMTRGLENIVRIRNTLADTGLKSANKVAQEWSNKLFGEVYDEQVWQWQLDNDIRFAQLATIRLDADTKKILNKYLEPQQQASLMLSCAELYNAYRHGQLTEYQMRTEMAKQVLLHEQAENQRLNNKVLRETVDNMIIAFNTEYAFRIGYNGGDGRTSLGLPISLWNYEDAIERGRSTRYKDNMYQWNNVSTKTYGIGPFSLSERHEDTMFRHF